MLEMELLNECYEEYTANKAKFDKMYQYYTGQSDAITNYSAMEYQESHKMNFNYLKKFIKEEVAYSVGTPITFVSRTEDDNIIEEIEYYTYHWDKNHDSQLLKNMLIYSTVYELYYLDNDGQFSSKIVTPRDGYAYLDNFGNVKLFMQVFKLKFDKTTYIDVYTDNEVYHYNDKFEGVVDADTGNHVDTHNFGRVPVSIGVLSEEEEKDTLFSDIKDIQDGFSIIGSDGVNEITNTRAAIMKGENVQLDEKTMDDLKKYRFANLPKGSNLDWLIKNLNADYQRLMLDTLEDKMYQLSFHVNAQEKMQSNTSSLALRTRLINLEQKTKLNNKALLNIIVSRIKFLFIYLRIIKNKDYDYRNIAVKFNSVIPSDDLMMAQIISQLGDKLSLRTALSQLSFVENPDLEIKQKVEEDNKYNIDLDNMDTTKEVIEVDKNE